MHSTVVRRTYLDGAAQEVFMSILWWWLSVAGMSAATHRYAAVRRRKKNARTASQDAMARQKAQFDETWRTDTVLSLGTQMYKGGEFGAMPILADALQDAGCDNDDILSHCRDASATHVRGCWVVDLVLGKE